MNQLQKKLCSVFSVILITLTFLSCIDKKSSDAMPTNNSETDKIFGLTESERKDLYKEIVKAEDKANAYKQSKQDSVLNLKLNKTQLAKQYDQIEIQSRKLLTVEKIKIIKKYNISEDQERQIGLEGLDKNWPLE